MSALARRIKRGRDGVLSGFAIRKRVAFIRKENGLGRVATTPAQVVLEHRLLRPQAHGEDPQRPEGRMINERTRELAALLLCICAAEGHGAVQMLGRQLGFSAYVGQVAFKAWAHVFRLDVGDSHASRLHAAELLWSGWSP